ncbi:hypothetical protein [Methanochimaera problematica]|nr:hypothetical protein [Methanoplanus sp. FWC-SCC4]
MLSTLIHTSFFSVDIPRDFKSRFVAWFVSGILRPYKVVFRDI